MNTKLHCTALQMKDRWESNINVWFPFMYSQKWNCYFQNRSMMFCLPVPTLIFSVIDLHISRIGLPILLQGNMWTDPGNYINRSQTHECGKWDWHCVIPRKGIHKWDFPCSVRWREEGGPAWWQRWWGPGGGGWSQCRTGTGPAVQFNINQPFSSLWSSIFVRKLSQKSY